ncbi:NADH dehydrogenase [ubiquinone] 1 beta subcomplex subunit 7-like [Limulus polyphemus]|uniref:NADH dehydrogenase [ubiquinone] 1 beta subcomplex subunit 7 n=1 Tax=Limulus polyphemus TaxID=6850 RepID=A0ABM1BLT3_LIMPO|nr:NADH dehydrogenase [ubiquinone] 1 beta subcomplex subunit 7-like [Limulus polyphemus]
MGQVFSANFMAEKTKPDHKNNPTFDPLYGFPNGRKERVMIATEEQMESAKLPLENRDYCAHLLLKHFACRADQFPFVYKCAHEKHQYLDCQHEDYILRMKEYEREKRLLAREAKKRSKQQVEELEE